MNSGKGFIIMSILLIGSTILGLNALYFYWNKLTLFQRILIFILSLIPIILIYTYVILWNKGYFKN
jgi:hypothetical protein